MTASWYKLELETRHQLEADGYWCIRPGGSKGAADIVAAKPKPPPDALADWLIVLPEWLFVQCKESGTVSPAERGRLVELAGSLGAVALVACWGTGGPRGGRTVEYRQLTGPGPRDWQPWTPNHAIGADQ